MIPGLFRQLLRKPELHWNLVSQTHSDHLSGNVKHRVFISSIMNSWGSSTGRSRSSSSSRAVKTELHKWKLIQPIARICLASKLGKCMEWRWSINSTHYPTYISQLFMTPTCKSQCLLRSVYLRWLVYLCDFVCLHQRKKFYIILDLTNQE